MTSNLQLIEKCVVMAVALCLGAQSGTLAEGNHTSTKSGVQAIAKYKTLKAHEDLSYQDEASDLYSKGIAAYNRGSLVEAEKFFKESLSLNSKNPDAKYNLAAIAERRDDLQLALSLYKESLLASPGDRDCQLAIAELEQKLFARPKRSSVARDPLSARETAEMTQLSLAARNAFARQEYKLAVSHLNKLLQAYPSDPKVHFALGQSLLGLKRYEMAAYHHKKAFELEPADRTYKAAYNADLRILHPSEGSNFRIVSGNQPFAKSLQQTAFLGDK